MHAVAGAAYLQRNSNFETVVHFFVKCKINFKRCTFCQNSSRNVHVAAQRASYSIVYNKRTLRLFFSRKILPCALLLDTLHLLFFPKIQVCADFLRIFSSTFVILLSYLPFYTALCIFLPYKKSCPMYLFHPVLLSISEDFSALCVYSILCDYWIL